LPLEHEGLLLCCEGDVSKHKISRETIRNISAQSNIVDLIHKVTAGEIKIMYSAHTHLLLFQKKQKRQEPKELKR